MLLFKSHIVNVICYCILNLCTVIENVNCLWASLNYSCRLFMCLICFFICVLLKPCIHSDQKLWKISKVSALQFFMWQVKKQYHNVTWYYLTLRKRYNILRTMILIYLNCMNPAVTLFAIKKKKFSTTLRLFFYIQPNLFTYMKVPLCLLSK